MQAGMVFRLVNREIAIMVEEKKAVRKSASGKSASSASVKAPAESAVWPFPAVEAAKAAAKPAAKKTEKAVAKPAAKAAEKSAKPAAKTTVKTAAKPTEKAAAKAAKPAVRKAPAAKKTAAKVSPSAQERYLMVQTAAYYIAEKSGFQGCATDHWAAAEIEISERLGG